MMLRPLERMRVARRVPNSLQPPFKRAVSAARRLLAPLWTVEDNFLQLGPELIPALNLSAVAWINQGAVTATSANGFTTSGAGGKLNGSLLSLGKAYAVSVPFSKSTGASFSVRTSGAGADIAASSATSGTLFFVVSTTSTVEFYLRLSAADTVNIGAISVREILAASVHQDSSGTLPTTYGSTVGLLTDRSFGAELGPTVPIVYNPNWVSNPDGSYTKTIANWASAGIQPSGALNKFYEVSFELVSTTAGSTIEVFRRRSDNAANEPVVSFGVTPGLKRCVVQCVFDTGGNDIWIDSQTWTGTIRNLTIREVRGILLAQPTAGARPTLTQTPRRLGPELVVNGALDSAAGWTLSGAATISGGVCDIATAGAGWLEQGVVTKAGAVYRVTAVASLAATFCGAWDSPGRSALLSNSAAGRNPGFVEFFFTANDALSFIAFTSTGSGATRLDNISVREVLEWSPALSFNGTSNFLSAAQNPLGSSLSQPYTMIVAGVAGALSATCRACGDYVRSIGVLNTGAVALTHFTTGSVISSSGLVTTGAPFVLSASWDGTQAVVRLNGVQVQAGALGAPIGTQTAFAVGQRGNNAEYWNGLLDPFCVAVPFVMSDTDRKTFERAAAQRVGATYLG